ncbi:MAG TPA: hypothetical protein VFH45_08730, partial [Acidimicrobiales bacterium]|nr:hypothetical protein [Acidimicrobiales bacterium]
MLVPDSALPAAPPSPPRRASLTPLRGKGMWIWQLASTEGGDPAAIVRRAASAGLSQIWVRLGDSRDGF